MAAHERRNQYAGRCALCGGDVPVGAGVSLRSAWGSWVTYDHEHAPVPDADGTTSDPSALRANRWEAECLVCGSPVAAGEGLLVKGRFGGWEVYHPEHLRDPAPPPRRRHPGWHRRRLLSVDIATTGNRYAIDRILRADLCDSDGNQWSWLVDPGPEPDSVAAEKNHGICVPHAREHGVPAARALAELADLLAAHLAAKEPLVVWHAPFVLTTLEAELRRHRVGALSDQMSGGLAPVCDPLLLDRHVDPYRSGGRSLEAVTAWYGVPHTDPRDPNDPGDDAVAALVLAQVIAACEPSVGRLSRPGLHREQVSWHAEQWEEAERRNPRPGRDRHWPVETGKDQPLPWEAHRER
ncbi:hypothetical protein ABT160_28920 [Streptomyces sp. NPDC001941]|uniref:hypothetical protein n=1 Tax=Streptomyces sp. NPDC001941 TaxID=3154659 RepID=UPI0033289A9E